MMKNNLNKISRDGKIMLLAYDQGFEHGPTDFDDRSVDPKFILDLTKNGLFTGVILQEGVAEKYYSKEYRKTPLIVKLNGKTAFQKGRDPVSLQLCTVERAVELGAVGIGYTIYVGSEHEEEMMVEFSRIEDEAHKAGLVVIAWMYPRGKKVKGKEEDKEVVAYAARLGLELNADLVKVPFTGDEESFSWVIRSAGKTGVVAQGGKKKEGKKLKKEIGEIMKAGAKGMAIGRNIWQSKDPEEASKKVAELVFGKTK